MRFTVRTETTKNAVAYGQGKSRRRVRAVPLKKPRGIPGQRQAMETSNRQRRPFADANLNSKASTGSQSKKRTPIGGKAKAPKRNIPRGVIYGTDKFLPKKMAAQSAQVKTDENVEEGVEQPGSIEPLTQAKLSPQKPQQASAPAQQLQKQELQISLGNDLQPLANELDTEDLTAGEQSPEPQPQAQDNAETDHQEEGPAQDKGAKTPQHAQEAVAAERDDGGAAKAAEPGEQQEAGPVPKPIPRGSADSGLFVEALYPFEPKTDKDLKLQEGDLIKLASPRVSQKGWLTGLSVYTGRRGRFPEAYVKTLTQEQIALAMQFKQDNYNIHVAVSEIMPADEEDTQEAEARARHEAKESKQDKKQAEADLDKQTTSPEASEADKTIVSPKASEGDKKMISPQASEASSGSSLSSISALTPESNTSHEFSIKIQTIQKAAQDMAEAEERREARLDVSMPNFSGLADDANISYNELYGIGSDEVGRILEKRIETTQPTRPKSNRTRSMTTLANFRDKLRIGTKTMTSKVDSSEKAESGPTKPTDSKEYRPFMVTGCALGNILLLCAEVAFNGWKFADLRENPFLGPAVSVLVDFGARSGDMLGPSSTVTNQWWRLLTSIIISAGFLDLFFRIAVLMSFGFALERLWGGARIVAIYLGSGVFATAVSVLVLPTFVGVTSSAAVFGVLGAFLAHLAMQRRQGPLTHAQQKSALLAGAALLLGQFLGLIPLLDNTAHWTGFAMGLALGLLMCFPALPQPSAEQ
eukprot:g62058.t1